MTDSRTIMALIDTVAPVLESQRQTHVNQAFQLTSLMQYIAQVKAVVEEAEKKRVQSSDESVADAELGRLSTAK